ncbi:hypothetical protein [Escherichia phage BYEP02]|nr:hypothetical protein [Escherichia phage BYEP02]
MLLGFKQFLYEASIDEFMGKIASCQTLEGNLNNFFMKLLLMNLWVKLPLVKH